MTYLRQLLIAGCLLGLLASPAFSQTAAPDFTPGQAVEVREGDSWSAATFEKKEGRKFQVKYKDGGTEEWVTADRIRLPVAGPVVKPGATGPATTKPVDDKTKPGEKPKAPGRPSYNANAAIDVKWGGAWFPSRVVNKRAGDWYLITYDKWNTQEWVEWWRIRPLGSTVDDIGHAPPNSQYRKGDNPPRADAGEPPEDPFKQHARERAESKTTGGGTSTGEEKATAFDKPITKADLAGAADILPAFAGDAWAVPPDPADPKLVVQGDAIPLKTTGDPVIFRSGTNLLVTPSLDPVGRFKGGAVERVSLSTSSTLGPINFGSQSRPIALSPSGKLVLARSMEDEVRIDLWRIGASADPEHVISFEAGKSDRHSSHSSGFIDEDHAFTAFGSRVVMWEIAKAKAVWKSDIESLRRVFLSPGGKYLYALSDTELLCFDAATGKVLGSMDLAVAASGVGSINPEGTRLIFNTGSAVTLIDLRAGKFLAEIALGKNIGTSAVALSEDFAILDRGYLFDMNKRAFVWLYSGGTDMLTVGGRCWAVLKIGDRRTLVSARLPHDAAKKAAAMTTRTDLLLKPGDKVALDISIEATDEQRKSITESLTSQIQRNGWVIDPAAAIHIVARTENGQTTQERYRTTGGGPMAEETVSVTEKITRLSIETEGKAAWESRTVNTASPFVRGKQGQTIGQAVAETNKFYVDFLKTVHLPQSIMKGEMPTVGISTWALGGVKDSK